MEYYDNFDDAVISEKTLIEKCFGREIISDPFDELSIEDLFTDFDIEAILESLQYDKGRAEIILNIICFSIKANNESVELIRNYIGLEAIIHYLIRWNLIPDLRILIINIANYNLSLISLDLLEILLNTENSEIIELVFEVISQMKHLSSDFMSYIVQTVDKYIVCSFIRSRQITIETWCLFGLFISEYIKKDDSTVQNSMIALYFKQSLVLIEEEVDNLGFFKNIDYLFEVLLEICLRDKPKSDAFMNFILANIVSLKNCLSCGSVFVQMMSVFLVLVLYYPKIFNRCEDQILTILFELGIIILLEYDDETICTNALICTNFTYNELMSRNSSFNQVLRAIYEELRTEEDDSFENFIGRSIRVVNQFQSC